MVGFLLNPSLVDDEGDPIDENLYRWQEWPALPRTGEMFLVDGTYLQVIQIWHSPGKLQCIIVELAAKEHDFARFKADPSWKESDAEALAAVTPK